jgi:hypothetical protein
MLQRRTDSESIHSNFLNGVVNWAQVRGETVFSYVLYSSTSLLFMLGAAVPFEESRVYHGHAGVCEQRGERSGESSA